MGILLLWVILLIIFASVKPKPKPMSVLEASREFPLPSIESLVNPITSQIGSTISQIGQQVGSQISQLGQPIQPVQESIRPPVTRNVGNVVPPHLLPSDDDTEVTRDESPPSIRIPQRVMNMQTLRPGPIGNIPRLKKDITYETFDESSSSDDETPKIRKKKMYDSVSYNAFRLKKKPSTDIDSSSFTSTEEVKKKLRIKKNSMMRIAP